MNTKLLALYGLKWNPFGQGVPAAALHVTPRLESFCWRVQQLVGEGGFALLTGTPGSGKSAALRILAASLATQRDVMLLAVFSGDRDRGVGSTFGGQAGISDELRARVVIWPPPAPNLVAP